MDPWKPADIKPLIDQRGKWCISLYMPTGQAGAAQQQDPVRLKALLAEAETKLLGNGLRRSEVQTLMRSAELLLWDQEFWENQRAGLAIFLANDFKRVYGLPMAFDELLVIANNFYIKSLLSCVGRDRRFYVLAVSEQNARIFQGSTGALNEIDVDLLGKQGPLSADPRVAPSSFAGEARHLARSRGHERQTGLLAFVRGINRRLQNVLEERTIPLILAGTHDLVAAFRGVSSYPDVSEEVIPGDPDRESISDLQKKAWRIIEPILADRQKRDQRKIERLSDQRSPLVTSDLQESLRAAHAGEVETLFIPLRAHKWGRYDARRNELAARYDFGGENQDLFDLAAAETILHAGQVYTVPLGQMPGGGEMAVLLRAPGHKQ